MGVELWLIRHGETEWSLSGAHTSTTDISLTANGRKLAEEKLKPYLAQQRFVAVFSSPMKRALETAKLAGFAAEVHIENGLKEWNYGDAEGKSTPEMRELHGPHWSVWTSQLKGGENPTEVGARADHVISCAVAAASYHEGPSAAGQKVALFAHAHILRILAARWIGAPAVMGAHFALGTGAVSVLGYERETRVISQWNRTPE